MRSKGSGVESPANGVLGVPQGDRDINQEQEVGLPIKNLKVKVQQKEGEGEVEVICDEEKSSVDQRGGVKDLSKDDLLRLLGVMEGEVQAREDVICVLKSKQTSPEALESRYGSAALGPALQALQRDSVLTNSRPHSHVNHRPLAELERLQEKHSESYRRMLGQLLLAEKSHRRTVQELETEKHKHADYMDKSDDFTNLLEQERERLKRLLENEKAYQVRKEKAHTKRLAKVREELLKLKSFALMLVDERQVHLDQMDQQSQRVQELSQQLQQREQALSEATGRAQVDGRRVWTLEAELKEKSAKFIQQHEEMSAKLADQESHNRQLNAKLSGLAYKVEELEESNGALKKSEEELQELRDKISGGECGNSSLMTELENLSKRVLEMEGKDEEITKTEVQVKELRRRLQEEDSNSKELRLEVEKLQKRMMELEKLEGAFNVSRADCTQLHAALEKEKSLTRELSDELVALRIRMKELESSELRLEKSEQSLKDDLGKLKALTVALMDERKSLMERMKLEERRREDLCRKVNTEESKVMEVTERLIEESKKLLRFKSEMETEVRTLTIEKGELGTRLAYEMDKSKDLSSMVSQMRLDGFEQAENPSQKNIVICELGRVSDTTMREDNKVKELTFEIERLKNRLKQLEVVEGDLIKTEDQYDLLEKRFLTEQDKANVLSQQVEDMRRQIARNKAIEKGEEDSRGDDLQQSCKREVAKTRDLQTDVVALKEKIHELMNKEDQLSQLQVDYSLLQQRFLEEEEKAKNMSIEVFHLSKELEATKRQSRALRPSLNGRRMVDVAMASTGVQTEVVVKGTVEEDTPAVFIRKSVQEENHIMSNLRQRCLKKPSEKTNALERCPSSGSDLGMKKSWIPWMRKKENTPQICGLDKPLPLHINGEALSSELTVSQKPGHPVHIRVTPDHANSTATLEISSPTADDFYSSSAPLSPNPAHPKPRITIIPTQSTATQRGRPGAAPRGPERAKSPVTITTTSRSSASASGRPLSPISIMTVSTSVLSDKSSSPEPQEITMGRAVFKVTPEKQMVPMPVRKYHTNTNIITTTTTEESKIHIHLGNTNGPKMVVRPVATVTESKAMTLSTGTVLRSPRHSTTTTTVKTTPNKVTSSITITPVTSTASRPAQTTAGYECNPPRTGLTRIPMSKSLKTGKTVLGALGLSGGVRLESRAESQSMRIEVKKSASQSGGKG